MNFPTLTKTVLTLLSINELYELSKVRNITAVEGEIKKRLISSDRDIYISVIDLLYNKRDEPSVKQWLDSVDIREGLNRAIPWKIGAIYDYRDQSPRIEKIAIIVGKPTAYMIKTGYFKPSWLISEQNKLTMREVINRTGNSINSTISVVTADLGLDQAIRKALMGSAAAEITTCTFLAPPTSSFKSYSNYLSNTEHKQIYPCMIKVGDFEHKLIDYPGNIATYHPQTFHVTISKSPEVSKLIELKKMLNIP